LCAVVGVPKRLLCKT